MKQISDILVPKQVKKKNRVMLIGLLVTGVLSATLVLVTYFGFFTGTNLLVLDKELGARGIYITKHKDLSNKTASIPIDPLSDGLDEVDYRDIDFNRHNNIETDEQFGIYSQEVNMVTVNYAIYQFYLINESDFSSSDEFTLNVSYVIEFVRNTKNLGDALGYKIFVDEFKDGDVVKTDYESDVILKDNRDDQIPAIEAFKPKEVKRITIYFWLEGELTNSEMVDGSVRIRIRLTIGDIKTYEGDEINA